MKISFTATFFLLFLVSTAQNWCHSGSVWTYSYWDQSGGIGYITLSYTKDTVVAGQNCKLLSVGGLINYFPQNEQYGTPYHDVPVFGFSRNDTVFFYRYQDSAFIPSYFFNVGAHDTIRFINSMHYYPNALCDTTHLIVDSIGLDTINGMALQYYIFHQADTEQYYVYDTLFDTINGTVHYSLLGNFRTEERLGGFFDYGAPHFPCGTTDDLNNSLLCYQDDSFPSHLVSAIPCNNNVLAISETGFGLQSIYPNPSNGNFTITGYAFKPIEQLRIYNALGQLVFENEKINPAGYFKQDVKLPNPAPGMYQVVLSSSGQINAATIVIENTR